MSSNLILRPKVTGRAFESHRVHQGTVTFRILGTTLKTLAEKCRLYHLIGTSKSPLSLTKYG